MSNTILCVVLTTLLICNHIVDGKKVKKIKLPKNNEEDSSPQPSVVTYSTFGFNDVGSYDGFVPSSPDYASYLNSVNQDTSTRLYAPAFPTALESTGFDNNYDNGPLVGQSFNSGGESGPQSSMVQYQQNSMNFFSTPTFDNSDVQNKNAAPEEIYGRNADETNSPVYGAKISSRHKTKPFSQFNNTEFSVYDSGSSNPSENKYNSFHETETINENKPMLYGESSNNFQNIYNYAPTYPSTDVEDLVKPAPTNSPSSLKFPKVIDYTKFKQYYPTEIENKYLTDAIKPVSVQHSSVKNVQNENTNTNNYDNQGSKFVNPTSTFQNTFNYKNNEDEIEDEENKFNSNNNQDFSINYVRYPVSKNTKHKDKYKSKPLVSTSNIGNDFKNWMNPTKGYEYSTNYSNTRFKFNNGGGKKPFNSNTDEVIPASSNIIDFPDIEYDLKKIPNVNPYFNDEYSNIQTFKNTEKFKQDDFIDQYKNLYSTIPTTTSHWGNAFKSNEYSSFKYHPKKPQFNDDYSDDVVHIPKRPQTHKYIFGKHIESKPSDLSLYTKQRPYKANKIPNSWNNNNDLPNTRFKSEEDLLGLRTHDTSHPSYLPSYKPYSDVQFDSNVYKKLIEKWKQSYWKAKLKDSYNDYESYETETKPVHVPVPKPYPIEVPHPVVVPVPQPYPVRVPIPKPVAVPVVKELTVPIEKPVPYPVVIKVPYPVEKPVPVPVEKQVTVPVMKPYPVMIPHIRSVFHHTKSHDDPNGFAEIEEETDFSHRPNKKVPYTKRPKNTRIRTRRPSRTAYRYQDRNRRRWPTLKPSGFTRDQRYVRKPAYTDYQPSSYKYQEELSDYDHDSDPSDYYACKRRGNC